MKKIVFVFFIIIQFISAYQTDNIIWSMKKLSKIDNEIKNINYTIRDVLYWNYQENFNDYKNLSNTDIVEYILSLKFLRKKYKNINYISNILDKDDFKTYDKLIYVLIDYTCNYKAIRDICMDDLEDIANNNLELYGIPYLKFISKQTLDLIKNIDINSYKEIIKQQKYIDNKFINIMSRLDFLNSLGNSSYDIERLYCEFDTKCMDYINKMKDLPNQLLNLIRDIKNDLFSKKITLDLMSYKEKLQQLNKINIKNIQVEKYIKKNVKYLQKNNDIYNIIVNYYLLNVCEINFDLEECKYLTFNINKNLNVKLINNLPLKDYLSEENKKLYSKYLIKVINASFLKKIKDKCNFKENSIETCYKVTSQWKNSILFSYLNNNNKKKLIELNKKTLYIIKAISSLKKLKAQVENLNYTIREASDSEIDIDKYETKLNKFENEFHQYPSIYDDIDFDYKYLRESISDTLESIEESINRIKQEKKETFLNYLFIIDSIIGGIIAVLLAKKMGLDLSQQETVIETKTDRRYKKGYREVGRHKTFPLGIRIFVITSIILYFLQVMLF